MSRPDIALHKKENVMDYKANQYVRRSQKDYSMSFKLSVVSEIKRGEVSVTGAQRKYGIRGNATLLNWLRKYGAFDRKNQTPGNMPKSKDQKILEPEQKIKLLEKQAENSEKKAIFFDMMIDIAEKEFNIAIRKNSLPEQSTDS